MYEKWFWESWFDFGDKRLKVMCKSSGDFWSYFFVININDLECKELVSFVFFVKKYGIWSFEGVVIFFCFIVV